MNTLVTFPPGFVWGAATAAFQIEGAAAEDGRRPSIWDTFCRVPGKVRDGDTGDIACDHYRRLEADLDLMSELRLPSYRFSVSWPRVIPDGRGKINQVGLDFYERLVDGLLARDIAPLLTLYHWDLPQPLQDNGGWVNRETVDRFVEYAEVIGRALGDRVPTVATLNEPFCSAFLGYAAGVHAPGIRDNGSALAVAHHLNLAHGRATRALRTVLPATAQLSITLNIVQAEPASDSDADQEACRRVDTLANRIFLEPILRGTYPERLIADTRSITDWSFSKDGDLADIAAPIDVLGVNYYNPVVIAATPQDDRQSAVRHRHNDADAGDTPDPWPGTESAYSVPQPGPYTDMGWPIRSDGLTRLLTRMHHEYPDVPLIITENGAAYPDTVAADGRIHDRDRIAYLNDHLVAVRAAIDAGVDVRGYYVWSLMDNFEWAEGYSKRFGIVYVDYETLERIPKDSARWFSDVITTNAVEDGHVDPDRRLPNP
jgi:beta-glucosidase